jgi:hypothetical protein
MSMHTHDIMLNVEEREIRGKYSSYDGWTITRLYPKDPSDPHFQVSRRNGQALETIAVYASYSLKPSLGLPADGKKRMVLVPSGADQSNLGPGIGVIPMASYAFSGKDLIWQTKKKNAKTVVVPPVSF